jgi:hypothetical protein
VLTMRSKKNSQDEYDDKTAMSHHLLATSSEQNNNDAITKILASGHDDDDSSYMHSIMERRRHIKPQKDDDEDESVATNVPLLPHQRRTAAMSRRNDRRRARSSSNSNRRAINPIILIVLMGLAANWVASRLLDGLIQTNDEVAETTNAHTMSQDQMNTHAQVSFQSEGERIGMLSLTKLPEQSKEEKLSQMHGRHESIREDSNSPNSGNKEQDEEIEEKMERLRIGIAALKDQLAVTNKDAVTAESKGNEEETKQQSPSSPITKRFELLRKRLLPLYSEAVPTNLEGSSNTTIHPLFNSQSPQFQALNWLSNIDKSQIAEDDPHIVQRYSLTVLYFATGGPPVDHNTDFSLKRRGGPWRNPTNFLTPNHECEWKSSVKKGEGRGGGIRRCDADKNVVELSIYNELSGTIPSELGRLSFLRTLYLGRNNLVGTIPTELGMIKPVASISLQYNQLTGEIPQSYLHRIPTLRFLQLEGNPLSGKIDKDGPLCQMRVDKKRNAETNSEQKRLLRVLTATCATGDDESLGDILQCDCCSKCFAKEEENEAD